MTPEITNRILRRFESGYPMNQDRGTPIDLGAGITRTAKLAERMRNGTWELSDDPVGTFAQMRERGDDIRFPNLVSVVRAKICAMNHDTVTAGLWALAGFDPALVHFAELREHLRTLPEEHQSRISLDRALSIYLEGQCSELLRGAGITKHDMDLSIDVHLDNLDTTTADVLGCTDDPLAMEIFGYALHLGVLTAHGTAPWKRYAAVMSECSQIMHPAVVVA